MNTPLPSQRPALHFRVVALFSFLYLFLSSAVQAQHPEDFGKLLEVECIEGNCKNGTGTLKVYPKGKDYNGYMVFKGTFVKKKLEGKGSMQGVYLGGSTVTGNFKDGRIVLNDTLEIEDSEWKGIGVFYKKPDFTSSDKIPLWADLWYKNPRPDRPIRQVGTMNYTATIFNFMADWMEIMYPNGISVLGAGMQGRLTLPCGATGFNDGGTTPVLTDTTPDGIRREGRYDLKKPLCLKDGWFTHYMKDGTEYSVRYENDSAVFSYHITADSIKRREIQKRKNADEKEEKRKLAIWRASPEYRALMAKYESTTYEAVNASLKKAREEGKKKLAQYEDEGSLDPDACAYCRGKGTDIRKRCGARGCINGKVKDNAGTRVDILDGGIGRKAVKFTPTYREFECSRCNGEGTWVCYVCNGTGKNKKSGQ